MEKSKVLLAVSNGNSQDKLEEVLWKQGFEVDTASSTQEAFGVSMGSEYALIVSNLPSRKKHEHISKDDLYFGWLSSRKESKLIILASREQEKDAVDWVQSGAHTYILTEEGYQGALANVTRRIKLRNELKQIRTRNTLKRPKILIVEDEEIIIAIMKKDLEEDFEIITRSSAGEVYEILSKTPIALAILDKRLEQPDGIAEDGIELARSIKRNYPYLSLVIASGTVEKSEINHYVENGTFYAFLRKPYEGIDLENTIKSALAHRQEQLEKLYVNFTPQLVALAGPGGSGKTGIVDRVEIAYSTTSRIIRVTERAPRPGEENGKDHFFVPKGFCTEYPQRFPDQLIVGLHEGKIPYYYGVLKQDIQSLYDSGIDALLPITDPEFWDKVKVEYQDMLTISLESPTDILVRREIARGGMLRGREALQKSADMFRERNTQFDLNIQNNSEGIEYDRFGNPILTPADEFEFANRAYQIGSWIKSKRMGD